jgi:hypothetical protein
MSKLYFQDQHSEWCMSLKWIKNDMIDDGIAEQTVIVAQKCSDPDPFYCGHYGAVGLKSEGGCGRICEGYQPRNGKRGMCKHQRPTYEPSDETLIVRVKLD